VYQFKCNLCDARYVGYTLGHLHERVDGHKKGVLYLQTLQADERWLQITYTTAANPMEVVIWRPMERSPLSVIFVANVLGKQDI